ncbi:hypothetical protein LDO26_08610 [Luteimonas sp. BDR2-5]|uniref:hypothetical protein n=1 Tax=Proluteimonas luteida TaxID=2878685 RepID=UPI001E4E6FDF|nr:hypothetical protein [Luteimonas sp. BDR2-5]MCD9028271.1 hypothetical protein [Luteimonas sp. BDR2-5]
MAALRYGDECASCDRVIARIENVINIAHPFHRNTTESDVPCASEFQARIRTAMRNIEPDRNLVIALGRNARASYPGRSWEEIEPVLRSSWEFDARLHAWRDVRAAVHAVWQGGDNATAATRG